ncbi:YihY/virulence factor BrkB family protein [Nocardioides sp. SYSU D00038]|uniref:YihY/virulence factor BrkB family protein n=1 Tax=Nocardioides sp. SYSU D00038 TaxID=2812554 RepID=UPI0027DD91F4|nr:YihY/virulence factor BrkB family protein [Nocardioides sp. SYSU D00038]
MGKILDAADRGQRRFPPVAVPIAVFYKFMDDQGNYLAAIITYYAFISIFPLLLLATSIFGFVLQGNPELEKQVLESALSNFPIIGDELGQPNPLQGSTVGVVVAGLVAVYGSMGLGQAIQNVMNTAWSVPRNSRPNPLILRLKSLVLLGTAGLAVLVISVVSTVGASTDAFGHNLGAEFSWLIRGATVLLVGSVLTLLFRLGAARRHHLGKAAPGAFTVAVLWQGLQWIGTLYVTGVLRGTGPMNQTFGLMLGLIGIIYIAALVGVLGAEINVVLARRLYPRALLTLFTDNVDLTEADRRAYASYAQRERHKGYESIQVVFEDKKTGHTHEFPLPVIKQERERISERAARRRNRAGREVPPDVEDVEELPEDVRGDTRPVRTHPRPQLPEQP